MTNPAERAHISALVINLASSPDRLAFQKKQLETLGIAWKHLPAVSVDDISQEQYEALANGWERKLRTTEVACFLSHKKAWEQVAHSDRAMLILEDDAVLSTHLRQLLDDICSSDYAAAIDHLSLETRSRKKLLDKKSQKVNEYFQIARMYQDRTGAAAYVLFPRGAQKLLAKAERSTPALADAFICSAYELASFQVLPAAAIQSDQCAAYVLESDTVFASTIGQTNKDKPQATTRKDHIACKCRRIISQIRMALRHLSVLGKSERIYVTPRKEDFLQGVLKNSDCE